AARNSISGTIEASGEKPLDIISLDESWQNRREIAVLPFFTSLRFFVMRTKPGQSDGFVPKNA
ncbi:MAG: hypothetical protein AAGF55_07020, partial [Pseudomonadota bacterium]